MFINKKNFKVFSFLIKNFADASKTRQCHQGQIQSILLHESYERKVAYTTGALGT